MYRRYRQCYCMNNNCEESNMPNDAIETACNMNNDYNCNMFNQNCNCGFEDDYRSVFPENPSLGQSYVPIQFMDQTYRPEMGLRMGTIFPELVSEYTPCQSMEVNRYLAESNTVGEGCNS